MTQMGSSAPSPARSLPHQDLEEDRNAMAVSHHFCGSAPLLPPAHPSFSVWGWWGNRRKRSDPAGPPGPPPAPLAAPQAAAPQRGQAAGHQVINDSGERGATRTPAPAGETAAEVPDLPKSCCCCTEKAETWPFSFSLPPPWSPAAAPGCRRGRCDGGAGHPAAFRGTAPWLGWLHGWGAALKEQHKLRN